MRVFVDSSAFLALINSNDQNYEIAKRIWEKLLQENSHQLFCSNYVVVETTAILQNRFGMQAVILFQQNVLPVFETLFVDEATHETAVAVLLNANRRQLSLVDCSSFVLARQLAVDAVFAFDQHFVEQGFVCLQ
ncbi:MAG: type II toxin-antitoxin system VapC family toxin [Ardenticatenaceae bacterium]|nr:type II toxin-antitoxin system VapC family toxin [Ardenticatenaceae bacterium]